MGTTRIGREVLLHIRVTLGPQKFTWQDLWTTGNQGLQSYELSYPTSLARELGFELSMERKAPANCYISLLPEPSDRQTAKAETLLELRHKKWG